MKRGVLRNFTKFTKKHLCQSLFFNKVAGLRVTTSECKRPIIDPWRNQSGFFPQRPTIGPLYSNTFLCDLFFIMATVD